MNNIIELIKRRRSVRTYDGRVLDEGIKEQLLSYGDNIQNPFDIPVRFKLLNAKKDGLPIVPLAQITRETSVHRRMMVMVTSKPLWQTVM